MSRETKRDRNTMQRIIIIPTARKRNTLEILHAKTNWMVNSDNDDANSYDWKSDYLCGWWQSTREKHA